MIKYKLKCNNKHEFQSWFSSSSEFEKLKKKKLLECIFCKSKKIDKSIMSPRVINSKINKDNINFNEKKFLRLKNDLLKIRNFVENNFEFVGDKFSKEVKEIYYDKKNNKNIYGTVTDREREDLQEEGIDLVSIPWVKKDN